MEEAVVHDVVRNFNFTGRQLTELNAIADDDDDDDDDGGRADCPGTTGYGE